MPTVGMLHFSPMMLVPLSTNQEPYSFSEVVWEKRSVGEKDRMYKRSIEKNLIGPMPKSFDFQEQSFRFLTLGYYDKNQIWPERIDIMNGFPR